MAMFRRVQSLAQGHGECHSWPCVQVCVLANAYRPFSLHHSCVNVQRKKVRTRNVSYLAKNRSARIAQLFWLSIGEI